MKYIQYYLADIFPFLCVIALLILIIRYIKCKKSGEFKPLKEILYFVFWLYLAAMLMKTVIPHEWLHFHFTSAVISKPQLLSFGLDAYENYRYMRLLIRDKYYFSLFDIYIINFLMLLPFGFLYPILYPKRSEYTILFGVGLSAIIELLQLFLPRVSDLFDIFLNAFGLIIGYCLYKLYQKKKVN